MLTLAQAINAWAEREAQAAVKARGVRAWNAGSCVRQNFYGEHGYEPLAMEARGHLVVDLGRRIEDALCYYADQAARIPEAPRFRRANDRDWVEMPGRGKVRGDGFVSGEPYGYPGTELWWDAKSMAEFAFDMIEDIGLGHDKQAQGEVYCRAYRKPAGVFTAYHRDTSRLFEVVWKSSDEVWARLESEREVAQGDELPPRPDFPCLCRQRCPVHGGKPREGACGCGKTNHKPPRVHEACAGTGYALKGGKLPPGVTFLPSFPCQSCSYRLDCWGTLEEVETKGWQGEAKTRLRPCEALAEQLKASTEVKF